MIRDLTLADALIVCSGMREMDAECVRAMTGADPGERFAVGRWETNGPAWTLEQDGPCAIGGMSLPQPWIGVVWLVAQPRISGESWRKLIRQARTVLRNAQANGVRRIEAHVLEHWTEAAEFARRLGFEHEGTRRQVGARGENVQTWVLLKGTRWQADT